MLIVQLLGQMENKTPSLFRIETAIELLTVKAPQSTGVEFPQMIQITIKNVILQILHTQYTWLVSNVL